MEDKEQSDFLILNEPMIDWFTFTSYEFDLCEHWQTKVGITRKMRMENNGQRFQNYMGVQYKRKSGSVFVGEGRQQGRDHYAMWASSYLAHLLYRECYESKLRAFVEKSRCTRVDFQITILQPNWWSQRKFRNAEEERGKVPISHPSLDSDGVETMSVYIGSKLSDRRMVVYQKRADTGEMLLRLEMRYKNKRQPGRADHHMKQVMKNPRSIGEILKAEVLTSGSEALGLAFLPQLEPYQKTKAHKVSYKKGNSTREWLFGTVCASLDRYLSEYEDVELADRFARILDRRYIENE